MAFFSGHTLTSHSSKVEVILIILPIFLVYSSVPLSHASVMVSRHEQHHEPETEAAGWNSAIINFVIYTCASSTVTCQNVFQVKGLLEADMRHGRGKQSISVVYKVGKRKGRSILSCNSQGKIGPFLQLTF